MKRVLSLLIALCLVFTTSYAVFAETEETKAEPAEETTATEKEEKVDKIDWNSGTEFEPDEDQVWKGFLGAEPTSLDEGRAADNYALNVLANINEPLVLLRNDAEGNPEFLGGGAKSWEVNEDGTVFTFHLRDNKWWDGEPVTAEDYVYGIKRAIDPETGCPYSYLLEPIKNAAKATAKEVDMEEVGIKALDEKTLEFTLEEPYPSFITLATNCVMHPMRKDFVEKYGEKYGTDLDNVMGCGPFKVTEWTHNTQIVLEKVDTYWNAENVVTTKVELPIISDENTLMSAFQVGDLYSVSASKAEYRQQFEANEDIEHVALEFPNTFFMFFNVKDELFQNKHVRRAFSAAVDREDINDVIWDGNMTPAVSWMPPVISVGAAKYRDKAPEFIKEMQEEITDPKAELQAGLDELKMDKKPEDIEVSIILGATNQWFKTYGEYLQQVFAEKLGVTLKVEQLDWPIFSDRVQNSDYQIGYMAWGSELPEPDALLMIHADGSPQVGTGWDNEDYNKKVREAKAELDDEKRMELYIEAEKILMDEAPIAPVVYARGNQYLYKFCKNNEWNPLGNMGFRQGFLSGR